MIYMDLLKEGQKLSIFFPKEDNLVEMSCIISEVLVDRISLDLPQYFMRYVEFLEVGSPLTVKVFSKIGTIDFNTVVISAPLEEKFAIETDYNAMKLTPNSEISKVDAIETIKMTKDEHSFNVTTFEISTEYIKIMSDYDFNLDDTFDCELKLPYNCGTIKFKGVVNYIDEIYYNEIKLAFYGMSEEDRQSLIYYMYLYSNSSD